MSTMDPQDPFGGDFAPPPAMPGIDRGSGMPPLAEWSTRVGATLLDGAVTLGIFLPFLIVGSIAGDVIGGLLFAVGGLAALGWFFYQHVQQGRTGQTFGKAKLGIRLLRARDGQPVGVAMSLFRIIVHQIDSAVCYLGYLWPLWDERNQTWTDKVLDTVVVRA